MKILVLYVFHEYNSRVENFFSNAIFQDENVTFLIIYNNLDGSISFTLPENVLFIRRQNQGFCFGGWSQGLLQDRLYENYDSFIFLNSSAVGPFLPRYSNQKWPYLFINGLQNNIHLFGSTINSLSYHNEYNPLKHPHVQTYVFAMHKDTVEYLIECEIFSLDKMATSLYDAVHDKEILMSRKIIEKGWNIGCLHDYYKNVDFTFKTEVDDLCFLFLGDIMYQSAYNSKMWNPYDLVFIKGNRITL